MILYRFKLSKSFCFNDKPHRKKKKSFILHLRIGMILDAGHVCCEPWTVFMKPEKDLWKQPVIKITHAS